MADYEIAAHLKSVTAAKLFKGTAAINKALDKAQTDQQAYERSLHRLAVSVLAHAIEHGDIRPAARLVNDVLAHGRKSSVVRRDALVQWLCDLGPFSWDEKTRELSHETGGLTLDEAVSTGLAKPFWDYKAEGPIKVFDLNAALAKLVDQASKKVGKDNAIVDPATLQQLQVITASIKAAETAGKAEALGL